MNRWICFLFVWCLAACTSDTDKQCTDGEQSSCACTDGSAGAQICADGAFLACVCDNEQTLDMGGQDVGADGTADVGSDTKIEQTQNLMARLPGLWIGGAGSTPLGSFPLMNMDMRPVGDSFLFSRVDLDVDNALRFALYHETIAGTDHLVYRNGGLFMGLERDTRTIFIEQPDRDSYKFCEPVQGCDYLEAVWTFTSETELVLDVKVGQAPHLVWRATRVEERDAPDPFPATTEPLGDGTLPFPDMPTLDLTTNVSAPSTGDSYVWVVLSDTNCGLTGRSCQPSRSMRITIPDGTTSGSARIEQIHGARYVVNAIWDRNGNFDTAPFPDSGDEVAVPDATTVVVDGATELTIATSIAVP